MGDIDTFVFVYLDDDRVPDMQFIIRGGFNLTAGDFVL